MTAAVEFQSVSRQFGTGPGAVRAVDAVDLTIAEGSFFAMLGPSGSGKTTCLRLISGFEQPSSGTIRIFGQDVSTIPPNRRNVNTVFQDYALFPHAERDARVAGLLEMIGLSELGGKYPQELSGGQQQRVALARALAPRPQLLLLDEPFSNLDVEMRERLSLEVRDILKREHTTAVLVTHDQNEAFNIADMIGVMKDGRIEQWDTPYHLYHEPKTRYAAEFLGQGHFLPGTLLGDGRVRLGELGEFLPDSALPWPAGTAVDVLLRPDDVLHDDASPLQAAVLHRAFRGAEFLYTLRLPGGGEVYSLVPSHHNHAIGEKIGIRLELDHLVAFPRDPATARPAA